jgi:hypothetical protein
MIELMRINEPMYRKITGSDDDLFYVEDDKFLKTTEEFVKNYVE